MAEAMETTELQALQDTTLPETPAATEDEILAYLRRSHKIAEIAALAEQDALILNLCEQFGITVSEEELQAAGDEFRRSHQLLTASETQDWLAQQRISVEDWYEGVRVSLLEKKLKEHLFSAQVDSYYLSNRKEFKRVALSQILVRDLTDAFQIVQALRQENASFCALAIEYSQGQQSKERGGFAGIHFLPRLMPEVSAAICDAKVGEVIGPIQTKLGYHILRIEQWFPVELNESVRQEIIESRFQVWLREHKRQPVLKERMPDRHA